MADKILVTLDEDNAEFSGCYNADRDQWDIYVTTSEIPTSLCVRMSRIDDSAWNVELVSAKWDRKANAYFCVYRDL